MEIVIRKRKVFGTDIIVPVLISSGPPSDNGTLLKDGKQIKVYRKDEITDLDRILAAKKADDEKKRGGSQDGAE